jgi:hypothetical protein
MKKSMSILEDGMVAIQWEEYKELLIIKGKYEELSKYHQPLIIHDGYKEDGTTIIPQREIQTTDPMIAPPYKITCQGGKHESKI